MTASVRHHSSGVDSAKGSSTETGIVIRYRRPEAPWSVVMMTVPNEVEAEIQTTRLKKLGYSLVDVT